MEIWWIDGSKNGETCQRFAHRLFLYACIWPALDDPIFYGQWTNCLMLSLSGPDPVTNALHFDLVHSSHMWIQAILLCGKHSTTMQIRIVSRLWVCRRPCRFLVNIRRNSEHLDVQETDLGLTQFYGIWHCFSRCRFTNGWDSRSRSLGFSDWSISFLPHQTKPTKSKM